MNEKLKQLLAKSSEIRVKLAGENSAERESELRTELIEVETNFQKELRRKEEPKVVPGELLNKAKLGNYLRSILKNRSLEGREAELNKELGLSNTMIPIELLEERADAVTTVASGTGPVNHAPIIGRIFHNSDAAFMGVKMPIVRMGVDSHTVITAGDNGAAVAKATAHDAVATVLATTKIEPTRIVARSIIQVEDINLLPGLEMAIRSELNSGLGQQFDEQILKGTGVAPNFSGLIKNVDLAAVTTPTVVATVSSLIGLAGDGISPPNSYGFGDVKFLVGAATLSHLATLFIPSESMTALDKLKALGVAIKTTGRLPAVANKIHQLLRQSGVTSGAYQAIAPCWQGVNLIVDPYSKSASGLTTLTATMLCGFKTVRSTGLTGVKFLTA